MLSEAVCSRKAVSACGPDHCSGWEAGKLGLVPGCPGVGGPSAHPRCKPPGADLLCIQLLSQALGLLPAQRAARLAGPGPLKVRRREEWHKSGCGSFLLSVPVPSPRRSSTLLADCTVIFHASGAWSFTPVSFLVSLLPGHPLRSPPAESINLWS